MGHGHFRKNITKDWYIVPGHASFCVPLMCPILLTSIYLDGKGWVKNGQLVHKHKPSPGHLMSDMLIC